LHPHIKTCTVKSEPAGVTPTLLKKFSITNAPPATTASGALLISTEEEATHEVQNHKSFSSFGEYG
jgi:hypothetical protein